jgi:hypothetical protein
MFYYAKLNENQVCTEVITRATKLPQDLSGFVPLPHYTEIHLYRKWDGTQWSQETFEPVVCFTERAAGAGQNHYIAADRSKAWCRETTGN